jgi:hypothetical protein
MAPSGPVAEQEAGRRHAIATDTGDLNACRRRRAGKDRDQPLDREVDMADRLPGSVHDLAMTQHNPFERGCKRDLRRRGKRLQDCICESRRRRRQAAVGRRSDQRSQGRFQSRGLERLGEVRRRSELGRDDRVRAVGAQKQERNAFIAERPTHREARRAGKIDIEQRSVNVVLGDQRQALFHRWRGAGNGIAAASYELLHFRRHEVIVLDDQDTWTR